VGGKIAPRVLVGQAAGWQVCLRAEGGKIRQTVSSWMFSLSMAEFVWAKSLV
jgi:hypothetical protein